MAKKSSSTLLAEYEEQKRLLDESYSSESRRQAENFSADRAKTEGSAAAELRSRYVAERSALRKLPQVASAAGLSGGALKSAFRDSSEGYASSREQIISERNRAISDLIREFSQGGEKDSESYAQKLSALRRRYSAVLQEAQRPYNPYSRR